jgi:hypothetical protein
MAVRRAGFTVRLGLVAGALVRIAHAEPTASEKETARTMMDEGHARRDAGDHKAALAQFQGADALMHVPTTAIEVAREQVSLGELVEARDTLERLARSPSTASDPDAFRAARKSADALDQALAARIPALRILEAGVPASAPLDVTVDGASIPAAALIAPIKVNPGHHVVVAAGAGARQEVDVAESQTLVVTLRLGATAAPAPVDGASADPSNPDPAAREHDGASTSAAPGWLRWGGFGLAGVGVVVGAVTGVMSLSSTSAATKGCVSDRCPPSTWGNIDSAHTTATISTAAFIVAGVGVVLGGASFVIGGSHESSAGGRVTAWIGPGSANIGGVF